MITPSKKLFRKEALERLSAPEQLDQLVSVVSPKTGLWLATLGGLTAAALGWGILGRIPITVQGQGVLIFPSQVVSFQSTGAGRLLNVRVKAGDRVKKGEVLATLDQSDLQNQLQQAQLKLMQLQLQDQNANRLQSQRVLLDQKTIAQQRESLLQNLQTTQSLTPVLRDKGLISIQSDRLNLEKRVQVLQDLLPTQSQRFQVRQQLQREGAISGDAVLQARGDFLSTQVQVNDAQSQLKQLDVKEASAQQQFLQSLNSIQSLQAQLKDLDRQAATQAQQDLEVNTNRLKEIQATKRTIAQLEAQLKDSGQVISAYDGTVLELAATPGQVIAQGSRLGSISAQTSSAQLSSVAFINVGDGKKIKPGMQISITPSTTKREEFGGISGSVTHVSAFPVTKDGVVSLVGNPDLAQSITAKDAQLQVDADLKTDPSTFSGYQWSSSKGPQLSVTSGTTTTVQVTVEERAPISFILPILKSWTGIS